MAKRSVGALGFGSRNLDRALAKRLSAQPALRPYDSAAKGYAYRGHLIQRAPTEDHWFVKDHGMAVGSSKTEQGARAIAERRAGQLPARAAAASAAHRESALVHSDATGLQAGATAASHGEAAAALAHNGAGVGDEPRDSHGRWTK